MTIQELAAAREAAWLAAHPDGHEYEQHDLLTEAQEELADFYNYVRASEIRPSTKLLLLRGAGHLFDLITDGR
jgi:hypothetical protein